MSKTLVYATVAGVAAGIVYVLSPLTVWFLVAIVPVISLAARGLETDERRWVTVMLIAAVALRLVAVATLFLTTNHSQVAFGTFFGDEEYALDRSLWLRNVALNIPLHPADMVTAFESANSSGYLYVLELIQTLFGPSPYGLHLLGVLCYVAASVVLFRLVHSTLGRMPALLGLMVLLFLPSLFAWSVSILKEPPFVFVSALNLVVAVKLLRASTWKHRLLALMTLVAIAAVLEGIRQGGAVLSGAGVVIGLALAFLATHPRFMLAALVATPIVVAATISRPEVQMKAFTAIRSAASQHWAYIAVSPGYGYKLLDERFYSGTSDVSGLGLDETMRFIVRAIVAYVAVPLPWKAQSRAALAYLPEQMVWYVLALLAPVGVLFAFRRDSGVTALLVGNGIVVALAVALTGGNVGALVRHRGLLLPYMVWMSAVGFCELLSNRLRRPAGRADLSLAYLAMAEHDSRG